MITKPSYGRSNAANAVGIVLSGLLLTCLPLAASAASLAPFKDRLFAYPGILESRDNGDFIVVDYSEMRDINGRDQVPERRVKRRYVDPKPRRQQQELSLSTSAGHLRFNAVGKIDGANVITVYIHGRGGDRRQGVNDYTFGGNFNRIKNLMVRNGGLYLVPDAAELDTASAQRIEAMIQWSLSKSPNARLIVACGSAGGAICHDLAKRQPVVASLAGLAFLGSFGEPGFFGSPANRAGVPLFIAHGGSDSVIPIANAEDFYRQARSPGQPVRMVRFETGGHGTPIRMTDWRDMINWMLNAR
jgi:predicted esterase